MARTPKVKPGEVDWRNPPKKSQDRVEDLERWGYHEGIRSRAGDAPDPDNGSCNKRGCKETPNVGDGFCGKHMNFR